MYWCRYVYLQSHHKQTRWEDLEMVKLKYFKFFKKGCTFLFALQWILLPEFVLANESKLFITFFSSFCFAKEIEFVLLKLLSILINPAALYFKMTVFMFHGEFLTGICHKQKSKGIHCFSIVCNYFLISAFSRCKSDMWWYYGIIRWWQQKRSS